MVAEAINSKLLYSVILNVLGLKISSSSTMQILSIVIELKFFSKFSHLIVFITITPTVFFW